MAASNNSEFYKELDNYRHGSGCLSLFFWIIIVLVIVGIVGYFAVTRGWL